MEHAGWVEWRQRLVWLARVFSAGQSRPVPSMEPASEDASDEAVGPSWMDYQASALAGALFERHGRVVSHEAASEYVRGLLVEMSARLRIGPVAAIAYVDERQVAVFADRIAGGRDQACVVDLEEQRGRRRRFHE